MSIYDNEGTLHEMTLSSADEEEQEAAQWALDEIERLRAVEDWVIRAGFTWLGDSLAMHIQRGGNAVTMHMPREAYDDLAITDQFFGELTTLLKEATP